MHVSRTWAALAAAAALAAVAFLASAQVDGPKPAPGKITGKTLTAASDLKWVPLPGIEGAQMALLVGEPTKEAHRAFFKYPAGLKSPVHTHTHGDRGVVVSGTLSLAVEGAAPKHLPPGSFFSLGAGVPHVTAVEGDQPCVFYMEREGPFDVVLPPKAGSR